MRESFFKKSKWNFATYCQGDKKNWAALSDECRRRDGYKCVVCGATGWQAGGNTTLQAHHVIPKSKGGPDLLSNLQTLCKICHEKQHSHMGRR